VTGIVVTLLAGMSARAASVPTASVDILDSGFSPQTTTIGQNGITTFTVDAEDTQSHAVTDDSGMGLYNSGAMTPGNSYSLNLVAAGTYGIVDGTTGNTATVVVPIQVYPDHGSLTTPFSVQWASGGPAAGYVFDVQISRPGQPFVAWQTGVTEHGASFLADAGSGQYKFQARLRNTANGQASGWSPWLSVTVTFASIPSPIGVVTTPNQMLVTTPYCGSAHQVYSVDTSGNTQLFATLPPVANGDCSEDYIDISPGLGGFPAGNIYVTQGPQIYEISPDGSQITLFATIPTMTANGHDGIVFDRVGSFGYDMLVTGHNGYVYKVNSAGVATRIGRVNSEIEGPDVAPYSFGPYGGDVLLAGEGKSEIWAMTPTGRILNVVPYYVAEHVNIVPTSQCTFGNTGGSYAVSDYADNGVVLYNRSMLAGLGGDALVTSEDRGGIDALTPTASGVSESVFEPAEYDPEGSSVVHCPVAGLGQAAALEVTAPTSVGGSDPFTVTVTALDQYGDVAGGYTGTVHFTSTDSGGTLPADYTFQPGDNGSHSFQLTLATPGPQTVTATDTQTGSVTGTANVQVAGPATHLVLAAPSNAAPGIPITVQVTAQDANGVTAGGYSGTVHFTSTGNGATLPSDYTFQPGDEGTHSFPVILSTLGSQTITASDTSSPSITGSTTVKVPSTATHFSLYGFASTTAGGAIKVRVVARDRYNNIAVGYSGTVHFTSSDTIATLPADYTFQPGDSGQHVFTLTLRSAGSQTVTATDTSSAITGGLVQPVSPAAASTLQMSGPEAGALGQPFTVTVTALDRFGNQATGYTGTVHFTSSDPGAVLPSDYSFPPGSGGISTFQATINTAGTQTVTATDTVAGTIKGTISVTAS